ncbi:MAG: branched-chain-amino-acid transaminase [Spirochaetaceae bacterium]|nr:MAG: branched-chain-amino-acid transaminase [Spirochaetaceae bacterium]
MASAFTLSIYPWVYSAQYQQDGSWQESYIEKPHQTPQQEAALPEDERNRLVAQRNSFAELPLVNYTTQYGLGCFEGLKAFPQADGSLKLFRPQENGQRMQRSMEGLMMPAYPSKMFSAAVREVVARNYRLGFYPPYQPEWEKDGFLSAASVYIRPFSYAEPGIGLNLSRKPWVVVVTTPVGSYFDSELPAKAITTDKARATRGGTGWIKCDANYVTPILVKKQMEAEGYMEAIFLDAREQKYVEEGSSCNIFFYLKNGTLVTPQLGDTILPGINRKSILTLARDKGVKTEERDITIDEAMDQAAEVFVTGTAAGVAYLESITHGGRCAVFNNGAIGELTWELLLTLKGIQYGSVEDKHGWMVPVAD